MKIRLICLVMLALMVHTVAAATDYQGGVSDQLRAQYPTLAAFSDLEATIGKIAGTVAVLLVGGIVTLGILFVLQYVGIDVIGWTLSLITFLFDVFFTMVRWTLASDANLIAMIILFIVFWMIALWGVPSVLLTP